MRAPAAVALGLLLSAHPPVWRVAASRLRRADERAVSWKKKKKTRLVRLRACPPRPRRAKLAIFFGDDPSVDTAEEGTVILESLYQTERAQALLDGMSKTLIQHIKSMVVAQTVVEMQQSFVYKLIKQGVLTESDAEDFLEELGQNIVNINRAKKERAAHMVKEAVKNHLRPSRRSCDEAVTGDIDLRRSASSVHSSSPKSIPVRGSSLSSSTELEDVVVDGAEGDDRARDWWMQNQRRADDGEAKSPFEDSVAIAVEADSESFQPVPDDVPCTGCASAACGSRL